MTIWRLRQGADRRIRAHHPWVFSNELSQSPKGHSPGAPVRLLDAKGNFVASGYGNPHSLIAFRALSFDHSVEDATDFEEILSKIISAWGHKNMLGYQYSFRLVYGEGDFLPGLVIDRYLVSQNEKQYQVFAVQILTAGMSVALAKLESLIERIVEESLTGELSQIDWGHTAIVQRNDVNIRRLEGLEVEEPKVLKPIEGLDLSNADIMLAPTSGEKPVLMNCDLHFGQKTGFFLDQAHNIEMLCAQLKKSKFSGGQEKSNEKSQTTVRVLDLCCYVGQWATQITRTLKAMGYNVEVTAVDVSEPALKYAEKNISREGAMVIPRKLDVVHDLGGLPDKHYDIVIADPPAFIKAKKDVPTGRHAYLKMNTNAFRMAKRGGLVVSCSCSGLFEEQEMMETLRKAIDRMDLEARCLGRGGHAADHPNLMSFSEGFYLKMFLHQVAF